MYGLLINQEEKEEIIYLLKREMDEILFDIKNEHIDLIIKEAMADRYKTLFSLFKRIAAHQDCMKYIFPSNIIEKDRQPDFDQK